MVLGFIGIGGVAGAAAAAATLCLGGGWLLALGAYSLGGSGGIGAAVTLWLVLDARREGRLQYSAS